MSGQQIGTVVGGAIGAYFGAGNPAAIQLGMAIGGAIGGAVDPTKINGPKIGDGQQQSATDGNPIAWIQGTAMVAGTIVQVSPRRQIRHKDNGKGSGTEQVTFTAQQDFAILICESCELRDSTMGSILMVMQDGKIVYDVRSGANYQDPTTGDPFAFTPTLLKDDSFKWKQNVDFMFGGEDQLPHPTLEAITGVGNTPAYRGSLVAVFKNFDVTSAGDRIPNFQFVVTQSSTENAIALSATDSALSILCSDGTIGQNAVGCGYYDMALGSTANGDIHFHGIGLSSNIRRYVVLPLPSDTGLPQTAGFGGIGAKPYLYPSNALFDTGWYTDNPGSWGGDWTGIWPPIGEPVPPLLESSAALAAAGYDISAGIVLQLPYGTKGVRVLAYETGGIGRTISCDVDVAQSSDPLLYMGNSRYSGNGGVYYAPWATDHSGLETAGGIPLSDMVSRVCLRGGLSAADIDVTDFASTQVLGYPIARQATAADCILPLAQAYFAFGSEYEAKLNFKFYGADAGVTVDRADLIEGNDANNGAIISNLRNQQTEFPRRIVGSYMDPAQNYSVVDVAAERRSVDVIAIGDQSLQIPVVMTADDAAKAVDKAMKVTYATLEGTLEYSVPFADADTYLSLAAGEPLLFQGKRWIADEMVLSNGYVKMTTRYDRQSAYTSSVQAIVAPLPAAPASGYSGPTVLIPMNLPAQRPQDSVGVYIVAASADGRDSWAGCTVQVSFDGMQSWVNALTIVQESEIGAVALNEPSGGEPITVNMLRYDLVNATPEQIAAGGNAWAVTDATGNTTQLGQFSTAVETATAHQFELTDTSRYVGGTLGTPVVAGNPFTMMSAAYFLPIGQEFTGSTLYFRGVGFGEVAEAAQVYPLVYAALVRADTSQQITEDGTKAFVTEDGTKTFISE